MSSYDKKCISCVIMGGLGNQLFQIFTTIATAFKHNKNFIFIYDDISPSSVKRFTFWNSFLRPLINFTNKDNNITSEIIQTFPLYKERTHNYLEIPNNNNYMMLFGYFQSYKYFDNYIQEIKNLLYFSEQKQTIKNARSNYFNNSHDYSTISIHFRVGDYKNIQECHPIMTLNYYINALNYILSKDLIINTKIIFFYEENDKEFVYNNFIKHINQVKFDGINIDFVDVDHSIQDWQQMIIMSCCNHNIIANSSFSWWAGYFNENTHKIVCYPDKWFGPKLADKDVSDMFPTNWHKINS